MSTYRERRAARAERLRGWATKNEAKSAAGFESARKIADGIPLGQPILVGHHSERRHRRDIERIDAGMRRGVEHEKTAREQHNRADEIDRQAERAIYRDDHDAIDRLRAKLADLETARARMVEVNKAVRKHGLQRLIEPDPPFVLTDGEKRELLDLMRFTPYHSPEKRGFPAYALSNLGGTISRERKRLAELEAAKTSRGAATVNTDATTATARAGLVITATQTTPRKAWKKPRPVWNVSGNLAFWRPILCDELGGTLYAGAVSFFDDPTEDIERACTAREMAISDGPAEAPAES